ncbi:hypothetical protein Clacol_000861 [Clathrus columnatus]|uniref:UDP-N-acetylglucosamine transferase subunit ALG14 n=1 Tax=Clathrus columnatus TaxID=1419009 RepID=A0AAV5A258_9AGAM|nr:hypothetical protein Clacol_000861 [Clathrus columnatus]
MIVWLVLCFCLAVIVRIIQLKPPYNGKKLPRKKSPTRHLAVFLGSGGHTSEALALLSSLNFEKYTSRTYFVSDGDNLSIERAMALEANKTNAVTHFDIIKIPRARKVHQSLMTTPSLRKSYPDVLILNGPGTCVMLCIAVYVGRFFMIQTPIVLYIESFARVKSLSLSGKLLRPFVDSGKSYLQMADEESITAG